MVENFEEDRQPRYPSLDSFLVGTRIRARREYWGFLLPDENEEDIVFEIKGFAPSKVYPRDGVVLEQISGPENEILSVEDDDPNDDEYELNASPVHAVARSNEEAKHHYVAFVVVE